MAVVIVLHAEGPLELGHPQHWLEPRSPLLECDLGSAHEVIRRTLHSRRRIPPEAVEFREPLRTRTGQHVRGSMLLHPSVLDEVLGAWVTDPLPLFVLLVDADDASPAGRERILRDALDRNGMVGAVGVAVREFESWLISDAEALRAVLGPGHACPRDVEALAPRLAKQMLAGWSAAVSRPSRGAAEIRRELAAALDLATVEARCPSFRNFANEIGSLPTK